MAAVVNMNMHRRFAKAREKSPVPPFWEAVRQVPKEDGEADGDEMEAEEEAQDSYFDDANATDVDKDGGSQTGIRKPSVAKRTDARDKARELCKYLDHQKLQVSVKELADLMWWTGFVPSLVYRYLFGDMEQVSIRIHAKARELAGQIFCELAEKSAGRKCFWHVVRHGDMKKGGDVYDEVVSTFGGFSSALKAVDGHCDVLKGRVPRREEDSCVDCSEYQCYFGEEELHDWFQCSVCKCWVHRRCAGERWSSRRKTFKASVNKRGCCEQHSSENNS
ncbi:hypothetical protein SELMODRAFT_425134 [Selaginella moellendorffii]|uniref:Uncharacterized protein n=1 Tax=Selaginella moellendorffii TaxID=88036 RepID=D8SS45_SELML|nr:hypothetical protein SELMODRAFT_425134 [Selaginella moellendorffii]